MRHPVECGVLFFEKRVHIARNLVLVAKDHIVILVDAFLRMVIEELYFRVHDDEHGRNLARGGFEQDGIRFDREYLAD